MTKTLDRAVETTDVVRGLQQYGLTQAAIASATGATERSVRNWRATTAIRPQHEERLRDLRGIVLILEDSLTRKGVGQWLRARNRLLSGERPLDLISRGEAKAVRDAAEAFIDGAYV